VSLTTDNGKLAALHFVQPWQPQLPFGDDPATIDEPSQQQLLWQLPEIDFGDAVVVEFFDSPRNYTAARQRRAFRASLS
jgi:hypothetical protein